MHITFFLWYVFLIDTNRLRPLISTDIRPACIRCKLTGIKAYSDSLHLIPVVQWNGFFPLMQRCHHFSPQTSSRMTGILSHQLNFSGNFESAPHSCGIVPSISAEIAVLLTIGCTGFTAHIHPFNIGHITGTMIHCLIQAVIHIVHRFFAENLLALLLIVNNQLSLRVINLCESPALTIDTVIGEGSIGACHIPDAGTISQTSQAQRCIVHICISFIINQARNSEFILSKIITIACTNHIQRVNRNCIHRFHHTCQNGSGIEIVFFRISGEGCGFS